MSFTSSAPVRRLAALLPVAALILLQGCSSSGRAASNPTVSSSAAISVTKCSTCATDLQPGGTVTFTASVLVDPNNEGVTWSISGLGALSGVTKTEATYTAPAAGVVVGADSVVITATGVHDTTQVAPSIVRLLGTPVLQGATFFPSTVGTPFGSAVSVLGGKAPFKYELVDPAQPLPPPLVLCTANCVNLPYTTITGTPTTAGTYPFSIKVTDANSNTSTVSLSLTILPAAPCMLSGQFTHLESGYTGGRQYVAAGSFAVSTAGTVTGHQDEGAGIKVDELVTGNCLTRTTNNGTLTITGATRSPQYNYALVYGLDKARTQLMNGGDATSGTGQLLKQDPTVFNQTALAGDWAFGVLGAYAPAGKMTGQRVGVAGRFTVDASGSVTAGRLDANTSPLSTAVSFIGSMSAPDSATGRGTLKFTSAGAPYTFVYYVVNANKLFLVQTDVASGTPQLAGTMTRQTLPYTGASLGGQGILSLWSAYGSDAPHGSLSLGRISTPTVASATTGTLKVDMDVSDHDGLTLAKSYTGATYDVDVIGDGRAKITYVDSTSASHELVLYLDGQDDGYVVETTSAHGNAGLLEAQMPGPYNFTLPGLFVSGTQFPQDAGPLTLAPHLGISNGFISDGTSTSYVTGILPYDPVTGRAFGDFTVAGVRGYATAYVVNPGAVRVMRLGNVVRAASIEFIGD